jgi:predicted dehydrogenase
VIRVGVVGLGKMGLSHHALLHAHPDVEVVGVCDSAKYVLGVLEKNTGVPTFTDYGRLLEEAQPEAVVIATPSRFHVEMVRTALERDIHVFCEKPLTLTADDANLLAGLAAERGLVTQVGYHNRFVAAFQEVKRLLDFGAIGEVTHVMGEAYGPVVLKPKGKTWRSSKSEGGGCLFDYAAHVINLVHWYMGAPVGVGGTVLPRIFSSETDDGALSTLYFEGGKTGQISVDWSDESYRKMTTRVTIWGTAGRIFADRQEVQTYLREDAKVPEGYEGGWNVRYTTELTKPVWFYLRGEEYSAQLEAFVQRVGRGEAEGEGGFESAAITDRTIAMMVADAERGPSTLAGDFEGGGTPAATPEPKRRRIFARRVAA